MSAAKRRLVPVAKSRAVVVEAWPSIGAMPNLWVCPGVRFHGDNPLHSVAVCTQIEGLVTAILSIEVIREYFAEIVADPGTVFYRSKGSVLPYVLESTTLDA